MHRRAFLSTAASSLAAGAALPILGAGPALAAAPAPITGPFVHANLAIYLLHGASAPGPVPLTRSRAA